MHTQRADVHALPHGSGADAAGYVVCDLSGVKG
jgi:hypothetical protein